MKKAPQTLLASIGLGCGVLLAMLFTGCATPPKVPPVHVFFPPPPEEPRIQYLTSFGSEKDLGGRSRFADFVLGPDQASRPIVKPYGVATAKDKIFVCDTQFGAVEMLDLARRRLRYLKPEGEAAIRLPIGVTVDAGGTKYVSDTQRGQVLIYDKANRYLGAIGKVNANKPCGVAVAQHRLYVTDLDKHCVNVYDTTDRKLRFTVPRDPADEKAQLHGPTNIAVGKDGRIYISDTGYYQVQVYDADGKWLRTLGKQGVLPGHFVLPKGIAVDHEGRVYVVDAATSVVQIFDDEGRLLMFFGFPKTSGEGALYLPAGMAIDYENAKRFERYVAPGYRIEYLILVVNQAGPHKVSVFGFLQKS